jgi:hypothetical protein
MAARATASWALGWPDTVHWLCLLGWPEKRPSRPCLGRQSGATPGSARPGWHGVPCRPELLRTVPGMGLCCAGPGRPVAHLYMESPCRCSMVAPMLAIGLSPVFTAALHGRTEAESDLNTRRHVGLSRIQKAASRRPSDVRRILNCGLYPWPSVGLSAWWSAAHRDHLVALPLRDTCVMHIISFSVHKGFIGKK